MCKEGQTPFSHFRGRTVRAFAPGRTEIAGNHTDHQGGRVIAAAVDCGVEIVAWENGASRVHVESEGFTPVCFDLAGRGKQTGLCEGADSASPELTQASGSPAATGEAESDSLDCRELEALSPRGEERGTTAALVRGVMAGLTQAGIAVGGFDAHVRSAIPAGGGLSSSAAFELALIRALELLFSGESALPALEAARIGQMAERAYFGKPCGLMDQLSVALGGMNLIDFGGEGGGQLRNAEGERKAAGAAGGAVVTMQPIDFDFESAGYELCLIDTHCDHSRYTEAYAQVAADMNAVARHLGASSLSQIPEADYFAQFEQVRKKLGDLPALRALHYYNETALVDRRAQALRAGDMSAFLAATNRSAASSAQYLQNVSTADRVEQPAMVALALADCYLAGRGAVRIHGGGFGGTVQAFVPAHSVQAFTEFMDSHLGDGSCRTYRISPTGAFAKVQQRPSAKGPDPFAP